MEIWNVGINSGEYCRLGSLRSRLWERLAFREFIRECFSEGHIWKGRGKPRVGGERRVGWRCSLNCDLSLMWEELWDWDDLSESTCILPPHGSGIGYRPPWEGAGPWARWLPFSLAERVPGWADCWTLLAACSTTLEVNSFLPKRGCPQCTSQCLLSQLKQRRKE